MFGLDGAEVKAGVCLDKLIVESSGLLDPILTIVISERPLHPCNRLEK